METTLFYVVNDILLSLDRKQSVLVLLDPSAAFDTVEPGLLLNRLAKRIGLEYKALDWGCPFTCPTAHNVSPLPKPSHNHRYLPEVFLRGQSWVPSFYHLHTAPGGASLGKMA